MIIDDSFDIDAPLEKTWPVLKDVPRVATCIPNAEITDIVDESTYRAKVAMKVGPVSVGYKATIKVAALDDATHTMSMDIAGDELKGRGGVKAQVTSHAEAAGAKTHVTLHADAQISGVIATVGGRLIESVARKTIAEFAKNLTALL